MNSHLSTFPIKHVRFLKDVLQGSYVERINGFRIVEGISTIHHQFQIHYLHQKGSHVYWQLPYPVVCGVVVIFKVYFSKRIS